MVTLPEVAQLRHSDAVPDKPTTRKHIGFITSMTGVVHRRVDCKWVPVLKQRVSVTAIQCFVYKLPACDVCWPNEDAFKEALGQMGPRR